jgi:LmbE family N-acetylglucosaminyl deacetylase
VRLLPKRISDPVQRKRAYVRRATVYGAFFAILGGLYFYQPVRIDAFPKEPPNPNALVNPETKRLFSRGTKIAIVTAHPDDSEFYLGALLLQLKDSGAELHHILLTDGDKGYMPWENAARNSELRRAEQEEASRAWGAETITWLGFKDGRLGVTDAAVAAVERELQKIQPDYVFAFDSEYPPRTSHGDHRNAGAITQKALSQGNNKPDWVLLYSTRAANYFADASDTWTTALGLLNLHKSQWTGDKLQRIRDMVGERWVEAGEEADIEAAVPLRAVRVGKN